jgi:hypothetical protein
MKRARPGSCFTSSRSETFYLTLDAGLCCGKPHPLPARHPLYLLEANAGRLLLYADYQGQRCYGWLDRQYADEAEACPLFDH